MNDEVFKRITSVFCQTTFEACHLWEFIPPSEEAQYLKNVHRHLFKIRVECLVSHSDRDIEIISLKHKVDGYLKKTFDYKLGAIPFLGSTSCEMLAEMLFTEFDAFLVEVSEDGENGAVVRSHG